MISLASKGQTCNDTTFSIWVFGFGHFLIFLISICIFGHGMTVRVLKSIMRLQRQTGAECSRAEDFLMQPSYFFYFVFLSDLVCIIEMHKTYLLYFFTNHFCIFEDAKHELSWRNLGTIAAPGNLIMLHFQCFINWDPKSFPFNWF